MYPWEKKKKPAVFILYINIIEQGWEVIEPTLTEINKKMREGKLNIGFDLYYS